jgi:hypothetical protein
VVTRGRADLGGMPNISIDNTIYSGLILAAWITLRHLSVFVSVRYRGGGPALVDLLGRQVRQRRCAGDQMQKLSAGKFHRDAPMRLSTFRSGRRYADERQLGSSAAKLH